MADNYRVFTSGYDPLEARETWTVSLLATDVTDRNMVEISRESMEETLKSLKISANLLAVWSNATCNILVRKKEAFEKFARSILTRKLVMMKSEYMGT